MRGGLEEAPQERVIQERVVRSCSCTVPRVAMLTTAGETFLIIGASVGSGVLPTIGGQRCVQRRGAKDQQGKQGDCGAFHGP